MTEKDWPACTDPTPMLQFLTGKLSDRKLRLFAAACIRHRAADTPVSPEALVVLEEFVDKKATGEQLQRQADSWDYRGDQESGWYRLFRPNHFRAKHAAEIARRIAAAAGARATTHLDYCSLRDAEREAQCCRLRDVIAYPARPVMLADSLRVWNGATVPKLAQALYADRAFDRLRILADALEDAGCDDADILAHCRGGGEHVRGCWVVDLILGKQ